VPQPGTLKHSQLEQVFHGRTRISGKGRSREFGLIRPRYQSNNLAAGQAKVYKKKAKRSDSGTATR
jgi:hypothetical protein